MKSGLKYCEGRFFIECDCHDPSHLLSFEYDQEYNEVFVMFTAHPWKNVFKRIKTALKYIFKKHMDYDNAVCISEDNIEQLEEFIKYVKMERANIKKITIKV